MMNRHQNSPLQCLGDLEREVLTAEILEGLDANFVGQAWGGAGVMVLSDDKPTQDQFVHFTGVKLITPHAQVVGRLYRKISKCAAHCAAYDYFTKREFWGRLTEAGQRSQSTTDGHDATVLLLALIQEASEIVRGWS